MEPHFLDRVIEEQAAYYGMSVDDYARFQNRMAGLQEYVEDKNLDN